MEQITCDVSANHDDRKINGRVCEVGFNLDSAMKHCIWFNIPLSQKREDDYLTVSFKMEDLLSAIGKSIDREIKKEFE